MKKLYNLGCVLLTAALALTGCSPDSFPTPSAAGIPQASDYEDAVEIVVDQELNQVTFNLNAKGVMPVWIIDGTQYSTVNGMSKIYASAGDYEVEVKILNANGMSDGSFFKTFHVNNTIMDFNRYTTLLAGDGTRAWRIDNDAPGHLACGQPGTDGQNWWSAGANEKAGTGLYDNRLYWNKEMQYTFEPGENGTIYVNLNVTKYQGYTDTQDFNVPAETTTAEYEFEVQGDDLFIVLPAGTNFPYIANNDFYDNPRLKVAGISAKALELIYDNGKPEAEGGIAWHFIFTSGAAAEVFNGFKYNTEFNLWKNCDIIGQGYYYAPGWNPIADPETTISDDRSKITVKLPAATTDQWQAQVHFDTNLASNSSTNYDFSVILNSNTDHPGVTVKLTDATDDGNYFMAERIKLTAYEDYVYYFSNKEGIDAANLNLFFDFGGCAENTEITIRNIVFKDHANDDGTVLPSETPEVPAGSVIWADVNSPENLLNSGKLSLASFWWANNDWAQVADPSLTINGNNATITATAPSGGQRWQGQAHFNTGVAIEEGLTYDFSITLAPSVNLAGATVKPHPEGDDGHMFSEATHDLTAYEDNVITYTDFTADFSTDNLVITLDFPGADAGTVIEVKNIIIQLHNAAPSAGGVDVNSPDNLMNAGKLALNSFWWADNNWSQVADPSLAINGNNATITVNAPSGGTQWQGQAHFSTGVAIAEGETYDFSITLCPSADLMGATVKPHPEGDDGHMFSEARHDLVAYEDNVVTYYGFTSDFSTDNLVITLDFPGAEAGTVIEVKDIIINVSKGAPAGGDQTSDVKWVGVDSNDNLMTAGTFALNSFWWANNDWAQVADPALTISGRNATITASVASGSNQWQGQAHFNTGVAIAEGETYHFSITLSPSQDLAGATVKPHPEGDDGHMFSEARHDLAAYEDNVITYTDFTSDFSTDNLVITLDFPGCNAGTVIEVKDIIIQRAK